METADINTTEWKRSAHFIIKLFQITDFHLKEDIFQEAFRLGLEFDRIHKITQRLEQYVRRYMSPVSLTTYQKSLYSRWHRSDLAKCISRNHPNIFAIIEEHCSEQEQLLIQHYLDGDLRVDSQLLKMVWVKLRGIIDEPS